MVMETFARHPQFMFGVAISSCYWWKLLVLSHCQRSFLHHLHRLDFFREPRGPVAMLGVTLDSRQVYAFVLLEGGEAT